jgi:hypothetical protein
MELSVTRKAKTLTLCDGDITSRRSVSRRSLLGTLGIGAAAAAVLGTPDPTFAADSDKKKGKQKAKKGKKPPETDND